MASITSMTTFYESKKDLFDIAGNVVNRDKYPFINVLDAYLTDIVAAIDSEIKNTTRNVAINWKEKKNPKLLSRFINNDDNINNINRSINKVTGQNYMEIIEEISSSLQEDATHKITDYSKYIFDCVIRKCMVEEAFTGDYIKFLLGFNQELGSHINQLIKKFVANVIAVMDNTDGIKNNPNFAMVRDVMQYKNIGIITGKLAVEGIIKASDLSVKLVANMDTVTTLFDWQPVNMDDLSVRMFLAIGIFESCFGDVLVNFIKDKELDAINECFNLVYGFAGVNNKIKFKILDIQDLIKKAKPVTPKTAPVSTPPVTSVTSVTPVTPIPTNLVEPSIKKTNPVHQSTVKTTLTHTNTSTHQKQSLETQNNGYKTVKSHRSVTVTNHSQQQQPIQNQNTSKPTTNLAGIGNNMFNLLDEEIAAQTKNATNLYKPKKSADFALEGKDIYRGSRNRK